jgi:hypothetical protein
VEETTNLLQAGGKCYNNKLVKLIGERHSHTGSLLHFEPENQLCHIILIWSHPSLLLLLKAGFLAEKQQIPIS